MSNAFYISSGHGKYVRGASGFIDEVDEARKVANEVARILKADYKATGYVFHDDSSRSQGVNLDTIVMAHNAKSRGIDVSVHFNAAASASATGVEVLHFGNRKTLASKMSAAMAKALGLRDRGEKKRADMAFLRGTNRPAILLEVCFVSNRADAEAYRKNFDDLCEAIAGVMADYIGAKKATSSKVEPAKAPRTYKVAKGDTLYAIARKYKTTVAAIKKANALKSDDLAIGQTLKIK